MSTVLTMGAATRAAYGQALLELGATDPNVVVLDADLAKSTMTLLFGKKYPERFFYVGAAEQNMIGIAAGLALCGKTVFASTFAVFATSRARDQIRVAVAQPHLNVKIVASHGGITVGEDGVTAHATDDLALTCTLPGLTVVVPADEVEAAQVTRAAAATPGPWYVRTGRPKVPIVSPEGYQFEVGRAARWREGRDATIIATGYLVQAALDAADRLAEASISVRVLNMATLKPLDTEAIWAAAAETGAIVVAEEHLIAGGLGSLVAQAVVAHQPVPMEFVGINDTFTESGSSAALVEKYGLTAAHVERAVRSVLLRKLK